MQGSFSAESPMTSDPKSRIAVGYHVAKIIVILGRESEIQQQSVQRKGRSPCQMHPILHITTLMITTIGILRSTSPIGPQARTKKRPLGRNRFTYWRKRFPTTRIFRLEFSMSGPATAP